MGQESKSKLHLSEQGSPCSDPLADTAFKSWLALVKGTWSKSDAEIYVAGFKAGWMERGRAIRDAVEDRGNGRSIETGS